MSCRAFSYCFCSTPDCCWWFCHICMWSSVGSSPQEDGVTKDNQYCDIWWRTCSISWKLPETYSTCIIEMRQCSLWPLINGINIAVQLFRINRPWCRSVTISNQQYPIPVHHYCTIPHILSASGLFTAWHQGSYLVLVSQKSWPGQLLSLYPCRRPKILARMLFWDI